MVERIKRTSGSGNSHDDKVGYRNPPKHSQFKPGQSGNPKGRRKRLRSLITDVKSMLAMPVKITEGGRRRPKSTQEAALLVLREKVLKGDPRAIDLLIKLAQQNNSDAAEMGTGQTLPEDDRAILEDFMAGWLSSAITPVASQSTGDADLNTDADDEEAPE